MMKCWKNSAIHFLYCLGLKVCRWIGRGDMPNNEMLEVSLNSFILVLVA